MLLDASASSPSNAARSPGDQAQPRDAHVSEWRRASVASPPIGAASESPAAVLSTPSPARRGSCPEHPWDASIRFHRPRPGWDRVVQEALNNVVKHAMAKNVYVVVERRAGQVAVIVEDDGKGVDSDRVNHNGRGVGLIGIRERAATLGGTCKFESHAGRGTTIAVRIPLPDVQRERE